MTNNQQKNALKHYAQEEIRKTYGFAPTLSEIVLLEGHFDVVNFSTGKVIEVPQYVLCSVNGHEYSCDGETVEKRN